MKEIQFDFLANRKGDINLVAGWIFSEWGHLVPDRSYGDLCKQFLSKVNKKTPPLHVVAIEGGQTVGIAIIKLQEMEKYPKDSYWLGSLVVDQNYRGKGIGTNLAKEICNIARTYSIQKLYLQTESLDGGLYKKLGWSEVELTEDRGDSVLVMEKHL